MENFWNTALTADDFLGNEIRLEDEVLIQAQIELELKCLSKLRKTFDVNLSDISGAAIDADIDQNPNKTKALSALVQGITFSQNPVEAFDKHMKVDEAVGKGSFGYVAPAKFLGSNTAFLVKKGVNPKSEFERITNRNTNIHESFIGLCVANKFREKGIPNFTCTYGRIGEEYLFLENNHGFEVFYDFKGTKSEYIEIFIQLALALDAVKGMEIDYGEGPKILKQYNHIDITPDNVMVKRLAKPTQIKYVASTGKVYYVKTTVIAKFIDYGITYAEFTELDGTGSIIFGPAFLNKSYPRRNLKDGYDAMKLISMNAIGAEHRDINPIYPIMQLFAVNGVEMLRMWPRILKEPVRNPSMADVKVRDLYNQMWDLKERGYQYRQQKLQIVFGLLQESRQSLRVDPPEGELASAFNEMTHLDIVAHFAMRFDPHSFILSGVQNIELFNRHKLHPNLVSTKLYEYSRVEGENPLVPMTKMQFYLRNPEQKFYLDEDFKREVIRDIIMGRPVFRDTDQNIVNIQSKEDLKNLDAETVDKYRAISRDSYAKLRELKSNVEFLSTTHPEANLYNIMLALNASFKLAESMHQIFE